MHQRERESGSWCPQKNSNLRFRLERAASLATRRWGRAGHSLANRAGSPLLHRHEASHAPSLLHRPPRKPTRRAQAMFTRKRHDIGIDVEHSGLAGPNAKSLLHGRKTRLRAGLSASRGRRWRDQTRALAVRNPRARRQPPSDQRVLVLLGNAPRVAGAVHLRIGGGVALLARDLLPALHLGSRMRKRELRSRLVTLLAVSPWLMRRPVTRRTAGRRHVVASRALDSGVPRHVRLSAVGDRDRSGRLGAQRGVLGVVDAGRLQRLGGHVVPCGRVAQLARSGLGVGFMREPRGHLLGVNGRVTPNASAIGNGRGRRSGKVGVAREVGPDFAERNELVGKPRSDTGVHVAVDALSLRLVRRLASTLGSAAASRGTGDRTKRRRWLAR